MALLLFTTLILIYTLVALQIGLTYAVNNPIPYQTVWGWVRVIGWPVTYSKTIGSWVWMLLRIIIRGN